MPHGPSRPGEGTEDNEAAARDRSCLEPKCEVASGGLILFSGLAGRAVARSGARAEI